MEEDSDGWGYFRGHWQSELKKKVAELDEVAKEEFTRKFLTMEVKDIKATYDQKRLFNECTNMTRTMEPKVEACQKFVSKLLKMHSEAMKEG